MGRTEFGEVAGGESVGVILVVVADGEEGGVELLQLHHVFVPNPVQRYRRCHLHSSSSRPHSMVHPINKPY